MHPLVSIIIPAYNAEHTLEVCLESLLKQTYSSLEIIIVNDGSLDTTKSILEHYATEYEQIRVIHQENGGVSAARNAGLQQAKGKYVGFVDSDDWVEPVMFERLVYAMETKGAQLVSCNLFKDSADSQPYIVTSNDFYNFQIVDVEHPYQDVLLNPQIAGYLWNKLFRKDLITRVIDEELKQNEDILFVVEYLKSVTKMVHINQKCYHYRMGNVLPSVDFNERIRSLPKAYTRILDYYRKEIPDYAWIPQRNLLKIYLNFRGRYSIAGMNDPVLKTEINTGIKENLLPVLKSVHPSLTEKANILLTWMFPGIILSMKTKALKRRHRQGDWSK